MISKILHHFGTTTGVIREMLSQDFQLQFFLNQTRIYTIQYNIHHLQVTILLHLDLDSLVSKKKIHCNV